MFNKKNQYLSIDIGNKNIKIVNGRLNNQKLEILQYDILETPINSISDGKIINLKNIVGIIQESIEKVKIKSDKLLLTITGTGVITRDIQIPKGTDSEIASIIEFEAQQYFPVDLSNYILDFKVLEEIVNVDGIFYKVLLVAVPIKQAEEHMKIADLLKLNIEAIDLPANCISKFIIGNDFLKPKDESLVDLPKEFAVLDIGAETTGVCIYGNNKLKFNRILLNGSSDIDKQISYEFNCDIKESESNKIFKARIDDEAEKWELVGDILKISQISKEIIIKHIEDIARFFEFYNSRTSSNVIKKIYLCGGGSKLQGLDSFLSNYFSVPVGFLNTSYYNIEYFGDKDIEDLNRDFVFLVSAIGAIIRSK